MAPTTEYHTPEHVSKPNPLDSWLCVFTTTLLGGVNYKYAAQTDRWQPCAWSTLTAQVRTGNGKRSPRIKYWMQPHPCDGCCAHHAGNKRKQTYVKQAVQRSLILGSFSHSKALPTRLSFMDPSSISMQHSWSLFISWITRPIRMGASGPLIQSANSFSWQFQMLGQQLFSTPKSPWLTGRSWPKLEADHPSATHQQPECCMCHLTRSSCPHPSLANSLPRLLDPAPDPNQNCQLKFQSRITETCDEQKKVSRSISRPEAHRYKDLNQLFGDEREEILKKVIWNIILFLNMK